MPRAKLVKVNAEDYAVTIVNNGRDRVFTGKSNVSPKNGYMIPVGGSLTLSNQRSKKSPRGPLTGCVVYGLSEIKEGGSVALMVFKRGKKEILKREVWTRGVNL